MTNNENLNPNLITLKTGKVVLLREKKGQHHIMESRLLAAISAKGQTVDGIGVNMGDLMLVTEVKTAISISQVETEKIKMPTSLVEIYELADKFTYEEWDELKRIIQPRKEETEELSKNLQTSIGSDKE